MNSETNIDETSNKTDEWWCQQSPRTMVSTSTAVRYDPDFCGRFQPPPTQRTALGVFFKFVQAMVNGLVLVVKGRAFRGQQGGPHGL